MAASENTYATGQESGLIVQQEGDDPTPLTCLIHMADNLCKDLGLSYAAAGALVTLFHGSSLVANLGSGAVVDIAGRRILVQAFSLIVGSGALFAIVVMSFLVAPHFAKQAHPVTTDDLGGV